MFTSGFAKIANPLIQPPKMSAPRPKSLGVPQIPKPEAPRPVVKDEYGKLRGPTTPLRPPPTPQAAMGKPVTKTASKKKTNSGFLGLFSRPHEDQPPQNDWTKQTNPAMRTEPLGATMPNQGTGGGIAGGYGSN